MLLFILDKHIHILHSSKTKAQGTTVILTRLSFVIITTRPCQMTLCIYIRKNSENGIRRALYIRNGFDCFFLTSLFFFFFFLPLVIFSIEKGEEEEKEDVAVDSFLSLSLSLRTNTYLLIIIIGIQEKKS
jgi:hypothetical protein